MDNKKQNYTVGFMFRNNGHEVALINKLRPAWQNGRMNGIGGHVEENEYSIDAMVREFWEETGYQTTKDQWKWFLSTNYASCVIDWYVCHDDNAELSSITDEKVEWVEVSRLFEYPIIDNLTWGIYLALDKDGLVGSLNSDK